MLNEEVDPTLVIRRLKQEVRDLKEEIRLLQGGEEQRGELTPDEVRRKGTAKHTCKHECMIILCPMHTCAMYIMSSYQQGRDKETQQSTLYTYMCACATSPGGFYTEALNVCRQVVLQYIYSIYIDSRRHQLRYCGPTWWRTFSVLA